MLNIACHEELFT